MISESLFVESHRSEQSMPNVEQDNLVPSSTLNFLIWPVPSLGIRTVSRGRFRGIGSPFKQKILDLSLIYSRIA